MNKDLIALIPTTPTAPASAQGDERRAIHEWLMREHKIEVLGNPEDDTAAVISLGTLRNIARVAMSAAQPVAQEAEDTNNSLYSVLAECRDAFPMPERGSDLESLWAQAMGDPYSVPDYVKAALAAPQPSQGAQPVVDQEPASVSHNGSCGSQVSGKPVEPVADELKPVAYRAWFDKINPMHWTEAPKSCYQREGFADGWNACREAILAAAGGKTNG